jgi:hypothetical protein
VGGSFTSGRKAACYPSRSVSLRELLTRPLETWAAWGQTMSRTDKMLVDE